MSEYLVMLFGTVALLGIFSLIVYSEGDTAVRFGFAVLLIYSATVPLGRLVLSEEIEFPSFDVSEGESPEELYLTAEKAFCEGVRSLVTKEFSLDGDDLRILAEGFDFEKMSAERIRVILSGRAALADYKKIEELIEDSGLGECEVEIEIG